MIRTKIGTPIIASQNIQCDVTAGTYSFRMAYESVLTGVVGTVLVNGVVAANVGRVERETLPDGSLSISAGNTLAARLDIQELLARRTPAFGVAIHDAPHPVIALTDRLSV